MSNLLKLANFIWEKVKTGKEPKKSKKINKIEHSLLDLIAALDRFDFHLVTGEKVWSHLDVIHSPFQGKTILLQLWLFTIFHSIFCFFLIFTFSRFFWWTPCLRIAMKLSSKKIRHRSIEFLRTKTRTLLYFDGHLPPLLLSIMHIPILKLVISRPIIKLRLIISPYTVCNYALIISKCNSRLCRQFN